MIRSKFLWVFIGLLFVLSLSAKEKDKTLRYDVECAGQEGMSGTFLVLTWIYNDKANISTDQIKEAAIRGVIFRGYSGEGCITQKPLVTNPAVENDKADFFNAFFAKGGQYLNYANALENSFEVIKISKKEYKVGMVVSVSKDALRKALEEAGVVAKLTRGF